MANSGDRTTPRTGGGGGKRELAFALQSLSASTTPLGRTRSGKAISSSYDSAGGGGKRPKRLPERSVPISPTTPLAESEAPNPVDEADLVEAAAPSAPVCDAAIDTSGADASNPQESAVPLGEEAAMAAAAAAADVVAVVSMPDESNSGSHLLESAVALVKDSPLSGSPKHKGEAPTAGAGMVADVVMVDSLPNALLEMRVSDELNSGNNLQESAVIIRNEAPLSETTVFAKAEAALSKQEGMAPTAGSGMVADVAMVDPMPCALVFIRVSPESNARSNLQESAVTLVKETPSSEMTVARSSPDAVLLERKGMAPGSCDAAKAPGSCDAAKDDSLLSQEKPTRRFTRSSLKAATEPPEEVDGVVNSADFAQLEKPVRRFTRSVLKVKAEDDSPSHDSVKSEDTDSTSDSASVKKMEMKMSKKVACLTKPPSNIRELLGTGLLEGMAVMYVIPNSKRTVLKGVIRGSNIRCFCASCNGSKVISSYYFEQHARSTKKHPSDYIYLSNGKNLRDVLVACRSAPLDALEKTIHSSIDPMVRTARSTCLNCNGSLPPSQAEGFLCRSCLDSKQPEDSPSPLNACASNSRSSSLRSSQDSSLKMASLNNKTNSAGRITRKDLGLHKLVFKVLAEGTEVTYYADGKRIIDGYIKDERIYCNHCNRVVSPSVFEAHAGEGTKRKPYDNIFTSNGVSLHELSLSISKMIKRPESETDDLCGQCGDGGDLIICEVCPRAAHLACVGLSEVPPEWYCDNCKNLLQKEKTLAANKNAKAAGRQLGVDPIEQIYKRSIRILPISDDLGGCALCKQKDFTKAVFGERTVILCDQCEREYHIGCLRSQWKVDLKELPKEEWFCSTSCSGIRSSVDEVILHGSELLPESDVDIIRRKSGMRGLSMDADEEIRWRLLAGRSAGEDGNLLLSGAVTLFHELFDPIIEANTGRDLIPEMVNGRRPEDGVEGQDYSGIYCAVLTVGSSVVSAALLRVLGSEVAELPLVATMRELQGLGYFQVLFSCIERMLASLKIKHFVLPAAEEAEAIWTNKFGFAKIPSDQLETCLNGVHLTVFSGTSTLYKAVPLP